MKMLEVKNKIYFNIYFKNLLDIGSRLGLIKNLVTYLNANVLIMGYRGYGKSTGIPSETGIMHDADVPFIFVKLL